MDKNTIKVKFVTHAMNSGDKVAIKDEKEGFERNCDDVNTHELEFDLDGNLIKEK